MGKIYRGTTEITSIQRGTTDVNTVYRGQDILWQAVSFDADALAYITEVEGTGVTLTDTQKNAINAFYVGLKADSLYTEILKMYPFIGGTAAAHAIDGIDPTNSSNDISWGGTLTNASQHTSNGVETDDTLGYGNLSYSPSTLFSGVGSSTMGGYLNRATTGDVGFLVGSTSGTTSTPRSQLNVPYDGNNVYTAQSSGAVWAVYNNGSAPVGFWVSSRTGTTTINLYKNTTSVASSTTSASALKTNTIQLFGADTNLNNVTNLDCQFMFFANGLSGTQVSNLYDRVHTLQTALSRNF